MNFGPTRTTKATPRQRRLFWVVTLPWGGKYLFKTEAEALERAAMVSCSLKEGHAVKVYAPGVEAPAHTFHGHA